MSQVTTVNNSSTYQNGDRVVVQTVTYKLSDDIIQLGQLQNQLGRIIKRIEELHAVESNDSVVRELANFEIERTRVTAEVAVQQAHVDGYAQ